MSSVKDTSFAVLQRFVAGANAQYREAGLGDYQMKLHRDGTVTVPHRPAPKFQQPAANGSAAPDQATAGAATASTAATPTAGAAAPATDGATATDQVKRSGTAPAISGVKQGGTDAFQITWTAVADAKAYGIWQDGKLIGHVTDPAFAAQLAAGGGGTFQIDAVRADGTRTELTRALKITRGTDGKISVT